MKKLRIPEDRVAVLIGEDGESKELIEDLTGTEITVEENSVSIEGEPLEERNAKRMVRAIGRGFSPEKAQKMAERDVGIMLVDVSDFDSNASRQRELKGRVIGRDGETRRHIEKEANVDISIYGSTVGVIGKTENLEVAREAIRMLLGGSSHSTAYRYLEKNQVRVKR